MSDIISTFIEKLQLTGLDPDLIDTALTHSSYRYEYGGSDNERLEFLGDAVLSLVVADHLFTNFRELNEGKMAKIKAYVISEVVLAKIANQLNIGDFLKFGKGETVSGGKYKSSVLASALEAVIGAVFLSLGYAQTASFLLSIFSEYINECVNFPEKNDYKSQLQEILQKRKKSAPQYKTVSQSGPEHHKIFVVEVWCDSWLLGRGEGRSIKQASQKAAEEALRLIQADNK